MQPIEKLEKQQVGIRLPKYLIEEIDNLTKEYNVNRTDIISESIKAYIEAQKEKLFLKNFKNSAKELKEALNDNSKLDTLDEFLDEL